MSMELDIAMNLAEESEGFKAEEYICPAGKRTQGFGRNLEAHPLSSREKAELVDGKVSERVARKWLFEEMVTVEDKLKVNPDYLSLNTVRRAVLLDMGYNMGVDGLYKFKNMFKAIRNLDYALASREMKDSAWYTQVGNRSKRNVILMAKGSL